MAVLEMLVLSQSGPKGVDNSLGEIDFIINYFLPKIPPSSPLSANQRHPPISLFRFLENIHSFFSSPIGKGML
jgi:hypothetical protein